MTAGSEYIGRAVQIKYQRGNTSTGTVVCWLPETEDDHALYKVLHDDGDSEDLDLSELLEALVQADDGESE